MTEAECLAKIVAPGQVRPSKPYRGGVIQVHVTRACNMACFNCTQGSQLAGKVHFMPAGMFDLALQSLEGYFGVVGVFGGNPCVHPQFPELCEVLRTRFPQEQCGLWSNDLMREVNGAAARVTFNPRYSNLNCHMSTQAYADFKRWWPESQPFGAASDSRHSPPFVAMSDVLRAPCRKCGGKGWTQEYVADEADECSECRGAGTVPDTGKIYELISSCDINQHWSAMVGMFRGELRAWFCEIAGAQSILHQDEPEYPDTGIPAVDYWWKLPMVAFKDQVRRHCFDCGVPLRGHGELAQAGEEGVEQVSEAHKGVYRPKRLTRRVELVTVPAQLGVKLGRVTDYMGNAR
jgi:hypothetical protein